MAVRASNANFTKRRNQRPTVLMGGDKGGVGKSFAARSVIGWSAMQGYHEAGFAADARSGDLPLASGQKIGLGNSEVIPNLSPDLL
ncbi:hypothetical protein [Sphingopyxis sp. USTB-05]|uniref:hypothetical protein n=1 Tax=Sphingopyxis sp. USTB-05 TaxID=2830667 RepID=UPI0020789C35|nr:hypothetical protein [Sphingopyxis sp. USTB-05]USI79097.1 hypothetical protein KEC45_09495 [Sphingopyxis sp. USTB-05]